MCVMRIYLAVLDQTPEARVAIRFAARRAARTGGALQILAIVPPTEFVAFGGVQAAIEEEARAQADQLVQAATAEVMGESNLRPSVTIRSGDAVALVDEVLAGDRQIVALVLGAAAAGDPGPLTTHFAARAGQLPCPLMIIPGALDTATLDRLT